MKRWFAKLLIYSMGLIAAVANAASANDLYEVTMPIEQGRDTAFADALRAVSVRVSGRRDAAARLGPAASNPRQYVQRFAFTTDNQLQVAFDSGSVDKLLSDAGLPVWGRERPTTAVLLNITGTDGASNWVDGSLPSAERDAMARAARQRGLPLTWPALTAEDRSALATASAAELMQFAQRNSANAVLVGQGRRDASGALSVRWTLRSDGDAAEASGSAEDGVHLAADTFSRMYAATGASANSISVEVGGIRNLDDYAATLNYLEGMTLVRSVAVEQVTGDTMRFLLGVRGDAASLRRAFALDSKLVPATAAGAPADRLQLRLNR